MSDSIQNWIENVLYDSEDQWRFWEEQKLDDTFGWGAMTDQLLSRMRSQIGLPKENSRSCGLLLTGPEGCGKHTTAIYAMRHLQNERYENIFLSGYSLGNQATEVIERMEALLTRYVDSGRNVCILLEEMEESPCRREVLTYFGQQLQNYCSSNEMPKFFLILIDSREADIPSRLRSRLVLCRMSLPTKAQRSALLNRYAQDLGEVLPVESFVDITAGATYAQFLDMISAVSWLVDSKGDFVKLSEEDLRSFVDSQMPPPTPAEDMHDLVIAARGLTEQLPAILERMGTTAVVQNVVSTASPERLTVETPELTKEEQIDARRKELEEMTPIQLSSLLFSEEEMQMIKAGQLEPLPN